MPHGITQCYLPPGRGDIPGLTPFSDPGGMQGWVDLVAARVNLLVIYWRIEWCRPKPWYKQFLVFKISFIGYTFNTLQLYILYVYKYAICFISWWPETKTLLHPSLILSYSQCKNTQLRCCLKSKHPNASAQQICQWTRHCGIGC